MKFLTVLAISSIVFTTGSLTLSTAEAAPEKIAIYYDESIHPETGELSYRVVNPNGIVDVTFTTTGARLTYAAATGHLHQININGDFPKRPEPTGNAGRNIQNNIMADMIESNGRQFIVGTIRGSAQQVAAAGGLLLLKLDRQGKLGFIVNDYGMEEVTLVTPGEKITLGRAIFRALHAESRRQTDIILANAAAAEAAAAPKQKNPIGFTPNGTNQVGGSKHIRTCEFLFVTAK